MAVFVKLKVVNVIQVEKLSKYYRQHFWTPRRKVLDEVSFEVESGEIFGFLGPNGSGKSTTIKILLEVIFPSSGSATLFGEALGSKAAKQRIGFLPENPYFYEHLSSRQFLSFHGALWGMSGKILQNRISEVIELVGMAGTDDLRLRGFSKGMLQRIGLAQAILHNPDLIILDEPMTGLDPVGRKEVRDLMIDLKRRGKTVFFSTHILSDVESICDRIAILNRGKLLSCGPLGQHISVDSRCVDFVWANSPSEMSGWIEQVDAEPLVQESSFYVKVLRGPEEDQKAFQARVNTLVSEGIKANGQLVSLSPRQDSLEDIFMNQIGKLESRV